MQCSQAKHARKIFQCHFTFRNRPSTSDLNYWRNPQKRAKSTFVKESLNNKNISDNEHVEFAQLSNGRRWEFRAGSMARLTSGSIVLNTDEDNAILGTVVCKYTQNFSNEEELIREIEENERLELNKNDEDNECEDNTLESNSDEYGIAEISNQKNEKQLEETNPLIINNNLVFIC